MSQTPQVPAGSGQEAKALQPEELAGTTASNSGQVTPAPEIDTQNPTAAPVEATVSSAAATVQLDTGQLEGAEESSYRNTIPLAESAAPPIPPLAEKDVLEDRYRVTSVLGTIRSTNIYRVQDLQGHRRCWACGSTASVDGETYCVDCGAQLTGRYYRLQEFNMPSVPDDAQPGDIALSLAPLPILENAVAGVAHVYDFLIEKDRGRAYIVWEEIYGRPLSAWIPEANHDALVAASPPGSSGQLPSMDEPEDGQSLYWMSQAAGILASLHEQGITGCNITLENLIVQAGDRMTLIDPSGCQEVGEAAQPAAWKADVRALAGVLESWYMAVREDEPSLAATGGQVGNGPRVNGLVSGVDEVTGPLGRDMNAAVVLARAREGVYPTAEDLAEALLKLYEASKPLNNLILWSGRSSNVGRVRQINEDSVLTLEGTSLEEEGSLPVGLYVIADGMGGHQSGEVASSIAIRTIGAVVNSTLISPLVAGDPVSMSTGGLGTLLQNAVLEANRRIYELAQERHSDLGTTVTVALIVGSQLVVANVGDSRTYLFRDGHLGPITRDHSLVAQLVASGQLSPDDLYTHPRRNEIYRALGDPHLTVDEVDTFSHRLQPGDGVLLCSDGLWDFVRDPVINNILTGPEGHNPQSACQALIDRANTMGGEDNISTIFVRVLQLPED